jgi:hypothetical protein
MVAQISSPGALAGQMRIHSGAKLKIIPGATLTCSGYSDILSPSGLWIASDATGTGSFIDNGTITYGASGSILAEKYTGFGKWNSFCLPVLSTTTAPFSQINLTYWTEPDQHFRYVIDPAPPDSMLTGTPFRGYRVRSNSNPAIVRVNPSGSLVTGAVSSVPLTRTNPSSTAIYNGFNFIGNPYTSGLDLSSPSISWNNVETKAWFFNPANGGNYEVFIPAGGGTHANYAAPFEGFFIKHTESNTISTTLNLNTVARTHTHSAPFNSGSLADLLYLKAQSASGDVYDQLSVGFRETATSGYDVQFDAEKLWGDAGSPQFYSIITGRNLTVQSLPWTGGDQIIPLGFSTTIPGTYKIIASNFNSFAAGTIITLEDLKLNITQSLTTNPQYQFTFVSGDAANRFRLHFTNPSYPAIQASNIQIISAVTPSIKFNWSDGNGAKRIVFMKQDTTGTPLPTGSANYAASTVFGSGTQIGSSGWYCVFNGTTHTGGITVTSLATNTKYRIMVCEYNEISGIRYFNTTMSTNNPKNQSTCPALTPAITGATTGCLAAAAQSFSTQAGMNSYTWSVSGGTIASGAGTAAITVTWPSSGAKSVCVSYTTNEGCQSTETCKNINVLANPGDAGSIMGTNSVCLGAAGVPYSVATIPNATTYQWTVPAGWTIATGANTRNITLNFPISLGTGDISVKGVNQCASGPSSNTSVSINPELTGTLNLMNMNILPGRDLCFSGDNITTAGSGNSFLVQNTGKVTFIADTYVKLLAGTKTMPGGKLHAIATLYCIPCVTSKAAVSLVQSGEYEEPTPASGTPTETFFRVFPNPASDDFTLELLDSAGTCEMATIRIRSLLGELMREVQMEGKSQEIISMRNLSSGVYLVSVFCGDRLGTVKMIRK